VGVVGLADPELEQNVPDVRLDRLLCPGVEGGRVRLGRPAMRLADEDQLLFIYSVEPGTPSHDAMRLLATWAATQDAEAAHASTRDVDDRASPMA
jgi:hypothetical protein